MGMRNKLLSNRLSRAQQCTAGSWQKQKWTEVYNIPSSLLMRNKVFQFLNDSFVAEKILILKLCEGKKEKTLRNQNLKNKAHGCYPKKKAHGEIYQPNKDVSH